MTLMNTGLRHSRARNSTVTTLAAALVATVALMSTVPALAQAQDTLTVRSRVVSHRDLDLSRPDGVAMLKRRIIRTANNLCEPIEIYQMFDTRETRKCISQATADAFQQVERKLAIRMLPSGQQTESLSELQHDTTPT